MLKNRPFFSKFAPPSVVTASPRRCVGRQTIEISTLAVASLSVPDGAYAATVQSDGGSISMTLDGATEPTSVIGFRVDDGVMINIDSDLSAVKMIARSAAVKVQVAYFDKP